MVTFVILQSIFVMKCLGTKRTHKSFHTVMSRYMSVKRSPLSESVATNVALIWKRLLMAVFYGLIELYSRVGRQQIRKSDRSRLFGIHTWNKRIKLKITLNIMTYKIRKITAVLTETNYQCRNWKYPISWTSI